MHLREVILSQIQKKYPASYLADKADRLQGLSSLEVLSWSTYALDSENQRELCRVLGISLDDFRATARVMKVIYNL